MSTASADVVAGTDAEATQYNNLRKDLLTGRNGLVTATDGTTVTFNLDSGKLQQVTLGGNRTLALSNANDGQVFTIVLKQDATGSRTATWWGSIKWPAGVAPTLTTTASKADAFAFIRISSTEYLGFIVGQNL